MYVTWVVLKLFHFSEERLVMCPLYTVLNAIENLNHSHKHPTNTKRGKNFLFGMFLL